MPLEKTRLWQLPCYGLIARTLLDEPNMPIPHAAADFADCNGCDVRRVRPLATLASWPFAELIYALWPRASEAKQFAPSLLLVAALWYWVGSRFDRICAGIATQRVPSRKQVWFSLFVFTAVCLAGALLPIGYVGYIGFGILVWFCGFVLYIFRTTKTSSPRNLPTSF